MYYTVYKITNILNNKIYIGVHRTRDLDDNYMGSGELIRKAIKKYGVKNFQKEYIQIFDNEKEMFDLEKTLVNEEFVKSSNSYNMSLGGFGGIGGNLINYNKLKEYLTDKNSKNRLDYLENPKKCLECGDSIEFKRKANVFCSSKCSATYNNKNRLTGKGCKIMSIKKPKGICKIQQYNENQKKCLVCDNHIPYEKRYNSFCGRSCKATYTNKHRYK
jgi:predicted nucleic acid-binding Zn ribbon protein